MTQTPYIIGLDIGSTTVKGVVVDTRSGATVWRDYQRHETRQGEKVLEFLRRIEENVPGCVAGQAGVYVTGSGGKTIAPLLGAKFVQEVNAVCLAVEKLHPEAGSVIELGGQDAKIIIFKEDPETGRKNVIPSMNDKCAGGTGAVLDKINAKLRIPPEELANQGYDGVRLHHVAGKCGVFAETDINSLQKQGVPTDELMASLFEAIVGQNLSVLTRGHTLRPEVLLLGGPNTFIRGMREAWRANIPRLWEERNVPLPDGVDPASLIKVPENSQYFGALGAVEFGLEDDRGESVYKGWGELEYFVREGRKKTRVGAPRGLVNSQEELDAFKERFAREPFEPRQFEPGAIVDAFLGIDGGSTSTKAVLLDQDRNVLVKAYQLSQGNPIEDAKDVIRLLEEQVVSSGARLNILGVGTTGYAKDVLKDVLGADAAIVETVAHTESALHYYGGVDVICDVGGQDIKIMILHDGHVKDFKLNTQCSAGNGYFLQSTAADFGIPVERYDEVAFEARHMPSFGFGCAVFLQSDIVDFQRQGWEASEIMAGLAAVLPKNIWLYVAQMPNLPQLGTRFVLQGGTQNNLAAVKAQVDFIESRFKGSGKEPSIVVHEHCGESGAIGAALEAIRLWESGKRTSFIGLDMVQNITYTSTTNEDTRCYFCKNKCLRTFIDIHLVGNIDLEDVRFLYKQGPQEPQTARLYGREKVNGNGFKSRVPLPKGAKRLIVGNSCEKGLVEDVNDMRQIKKELDDICADSPNLVEISAREIFATHTSRSVADPLPRFAILGKTRARRKAMERRKSIRIGIPRMMNMYSLAPVFTAYFESLGIPFRNIVFSDFSSEKLYKEGAKRGAIDPCYPSKLGIPHVHNLLFKKHKRTPLDIIFFPMLDDLPTDMVNTVGSRACPTVTTTPEAVKAAFIKEGDLFAENGITFLDTFLNMGSPLLFERQMYNEFRDVLGLSRKENARAVAAGFEALRRYQQKIRRQSRELLDRLEREHRLGIVLLARPYHNDPGINHEILFDLQKHGYPIFTHDNLPLDEDILDRLFGEEIREGVISHPMDISDVWKNSYSENTNRKIWAAKFTARHPNLVALEMSNFKCGHDAPIYTVIEEIIERSGTPYFNFKDLDENKPAGSIKIRIETILYFLQRYREDLFASREHRARIEPHFTGYDRDSLLKHSGEVAASARTHHPDGDETHTEHTG